MTHSSSAIFFSAGDKHCEFFCYNFQRFSRLKCITIYRSIIPYRVSDSKCSNTTCFLVGWVQVAVVIPTVMVAMLTKVLNVYNFFKNMCLKNEKAIVDSTKSWSLLCKQLHCFMDIQRGKEEKRGGYWKHVPTTFQNHINIPKWVKTFRTYKKMLNVKLFLNNMTNVNSVLSKK